MDIRGAQVQHSKYGVGAVVEQADNVITVSFPTDGGTKKFLYPSIFESYLTLCSDEMQVRQQEEITYLRAVSEADLARKTADEEQRKKTALSAQKAANRVRTARHKAAKKVSADD